jgi:hypothetical protein
MLCVDDMVPAVVSLRLGQTLERAKDNQLAASGGADEREVGRAAAYVAPAFHNAARRGPRHLQNRRGEFHVLAEVAQRLDPSGIQVELAEKSDLAEEADPIIAADLFRGEKAPDRR